MNDTTRDPGNPTHHILSVLVQNRPGVLARVASLFARRGYNIFSLAVAPAEEVGMSPAQYVAAVRVETARRELEATGATVEVIARRCGFGTAETMRRTFSRRVGVSPDQYRQRFRTRNSPVHPERIPS